MRYFILYLFALLALPSLATVTADFTPNRYNGCPPLLCSFTNNSTSSNGPVTFRWDFANGNFSSDTNPSAIFVNSGTYRVRLIATDGIESDTVTKSIVVFRIPQANFQAPTTTVCLGDTLFLNGNVTLGDAPIRDYAWGFGNGVASSIANPFYVYTQTGSYDITLVIQDTNRCSISQTRNQYIQVVNNPAASFTASPSVSCAQSQLVNFTNTSTGNGLTYLWQLTNIQQSTAANPSHTYSNETYSVSLTVTDQNGCTSTTSQSVSVEELQADFFANRTEACTDEQIYFSNTSNIGGVSSWDFGDGATSSATSPYHAYAQPGIYTVTLTQIAAGCTDVIQRVAYIEIRQGIVPGFTTSGGPTSCNELAPITFISTTQDSGLSYTWHFGDSSPQGSDSIVEHTYTANGLYTVLLTITDGNGCVSNTRTTVQISTFVPTPDFNVSGVPCRGGTVNFANTTAQGYNLFSFAYGFLWTFGDGDSSTAPVPTHVYDQPGTYTVTLTVTNSVGCDSTIVKPNFITIDTVGVDFNVSETFSPCPPFVTIFNSTTTHSDLTYDWNFGDGLTDTAQHPTHIYFHPGIFDVSLTVRTGNGCYSTARYPRLIEVQGPYGVFAATPNDGCIPLNVEFMASISDNTKNIWCDLGDGNLISDSLMFSYTYTTLGTFNPKFILVDHVGCTVPYELPAITTHQPALLNIADTAICAGASVQVTLPGTDSYQWTASPDITCDTCSSFTITPAVSHDYIVSATNQFCSISDTMHVVVDTIPVLTPSSVKVCANTELQLFAGNAYRIAWSPASFLSDTSIANPLCVANDTIEYTVTGYNSLGCSTSAQVLVTTINKLDLSAIGDVTACAFDSFQLAATVADGPDAPVSFTWSPAGYLDAANVANPIGRNLIQSTTFQVIAGSDNCAADTATVLVSINNLPDLQVSESITTSPGSEVKLWASSMQNLNYNWLAKEQFSCADCRITTINPTETQTVYVTGTNQYGCQTTDSLLIKVMGCNPDAVFMPNIFTPNGDGMNDELAVTSKVVTRLDYFRVFDEWGRMVFETRSINDGWDGKVNGQPASVDVFAYILQGKCENGEEVIKYGNITLVK